MNGFALLSRRREERRLRAARVLVAAAYTFAKLPSVDRERVEALVAQRAGWAGFSRVELRAFAPFHMLAAYRAVAMARLGIPPLLTAGWPIRPGSRLWPGRDELNLYFAGGIRRHHVEAAVAELSAIAPDVAAVFPNVLDEPQPDLWNYWRPGMTVRAAMRGRSRSEPKDVAGR